MVWDYPEPTNGESDVERNVELDGVQEEVEMELSDTPPRASPTHHDPDPEPGTSVELNSLSQCPEVAGIQCVEGDRQVLCCPR